MSARVLHVASHRINVGDGALIGAIQRRLARLAGADVAFDDFDIVDLEPEYGGAHLGELTGYALVLVGGGGTIDNKRARAPSGMAFPMSGAEIRKSAVPLAFVALGYNLFGGTRLRNAAALADVIAACEERGFPFSVRNDGSLARLRDALGAPADSVVEVPDPGFFVEVDPAHVVPQFSGHRPRVLLQMAADNPGFRFGGGGEWFGRVRNRLPLGAERRLTRGLAHVVERMVTQHDAEVVLAPHIAPDLELAAAVLEGLPKRVARKRVRVLGVPDPSRAAQFFSAYAQADLVIGMRGHAVICACGLAVPCVALSTHPKVAGFMSACGLDDWVVEYGGGFADEVVAHASALLADSGTWRTRRDAATQDWGERFDALLARCWGLVG